MNKYAVAYIRVSDPKQVKGYSLDSQDDLAIKKAEQDGYEIAKVFREEGVSATTTNRPELQEMMSFCLNKKNNISAVYVYALNRLNRNTEDYLGLRALLAKHGVSVVSVTEPTGETPEARFIETILAGIAEYENKARARNVSNSLRRRFQEGHITSKPPIGYKMVKVDGRSRALKDDESFAIIQKMWYRVEKEKLTVREVANILNKLNVKSYHDSRFKRFLPQTVSKIFANKFYMGILVSEKYGEAKGLHEPMIDEVTFYRVREILTGRRPTKNERYMRMREDFPLRQLLRCSDCPKKLTSGWSKGNTTTKGYYCCPSRGVHKSKSYDREKVHPAFIDLIKRVRVKESHMQWITEILKEKYHAQYDLLNKTSDTVEKDIEVLKATKKTLSEKHLKGLYTDEEFLEMKDNLDAQIAIKKGLVNEKKLQKIDIDTILNFIQYYFTHLDTVFIKASLEGKLRIGSSIFPEGVVFENGNFRTPILGRGYKLTNDIVSNQSLLVSREGFEPTTKSLKGSCSTTELPAHQMVHLIIPTSPSLDKIVPHP